MTRPEHVTVDKKRCSRCQTVKSWTQFSRNSSHATGLQTWCRDCHSQYEKASRNLYHLKPSDQPTADQPTDLTVRQEPAMQEGPPSIDEDVFLRLFGFSGVQQQPPPPSLAEAKLKLAERIIEIQSEALRNLLS